MIFRFPPEADPPLAGFRSFKPWISMGPSSSSRTSLRISMT